MSRGPSGRIVAGGASSTPVAATLRGRRRPYPPAWCCAACDLAVIRRWRGGVRVRHRSVIERLIERLLVDTRFAGDVTQRTAGAGGFLDDLGRLVVADVRVERGRRRERQLGVVLGVLAVCLDSLHALHVQEARSRR